MTGKLLLNSLADTEALGKCLAKALLAAPFAVLLYGDLGSGKTTLTRSLVAALPGGALAEVSSPSFTICNLYPTEPPVLHCDLYRLGEGASLPEEAEERLEDGCILIAEWSEYLRADELPKDRLEISFDIAKKGNHTARALTLASYGSNAERALMDLGRCPFSTVQPVTAHA